MILDVFPKFRWGLEPSKSSARHWSKVILVLHKTKA